jgi:transcriptional regulator with XRE-family HTH domain
MKRLKIRRIEVGLTQAELAGKVGVKPNAISCYEMGVRFPRKYTLERLAEALDCDVKEII